MLLLDSTYPDCKHTKSSGKASCCPSPKWQECAVYQWTKTLSPGTVMLMSHFTNDLASTQGAVRKVSNTNSRWQVTDGSGMNIQYRYVLSHAIQVCIQVDARCDILMTKHVRLRVLFVTTEGRRRSQRLTTQIVLPRWLAVILYACRDGISGCCSYWAALCTQSRKLERFATVSCRFYR